MLILRLTINATFQIWSGCSPKSWNAGVCQGPSGLPEGGQNAAIQGQQRRFAVCLHLSLSSLQPGWHWCPEQNHSSRGKGVSGFSKSGLTYQPQLIAESHSAQELQGVQAVSSWPLLFLAICSRLAKLSPIEASFLRNCWWRVDSPSLAVQLPAGL